VISNGFKQPVTDRAFIGNGLYEPVTDRFNLCNGLYKPVTDRFNLCNGVDLTSVTKNSCNRHLRSHYQKSTLVTGVAEVYPGISLPRLWVTGAKQQPLQMWVHVTGVKGLLQMMRDLFEVFA
jgi:hypothetical protein